MTRTPLAAAVAALLILCLAPAVHAQMETGRIEGLVTDATGAALPGVTVTVTNLATGVANSVVTDGTGRYVVTPVRAGHYKISAALAGFRTAETADVQVAVGQILRNDYTLQPGGVQETVSVTAESPMIDRVSSQIATVINRQEVEQLPLNGRNFTQLATLTPGVNRGIQGGQATGESGNAETFRYGDSGGAALSVNGVREQFNNFMLDGVDNNESLVNTTSIFPPIEGIQEFRVITSGAQAEYGRAGGAVINVVTRGGSNTLHGSAYEFNRNQALDATPTFAQKKTDFSRNQFGGAAGGPIQKNRTFFFGEYAGLREKLPVEAGGRVTVPTAKMRQGDFSELLNPSFTGLNAPIIIYNPTTGVPYPGNVIPQSQLNPVGVAYLNAFPLPDFTDQYQRNFLTTRQRNSRFNNFTARVDHVFSDRNNAFVRVSGPLGSEHRFDPGRIPNYQAGFGSGTADNTSWGTAIGFNHVFTQHVISDTRIGVNRQQYEFLPVGYGANQDSALGIPGPGGVTLGNGISLIGGGNGQWIEYLGDFGQYIVPQHTYQISSAVTWVNGLHTMKFGGAIIRRMVGSQRTQFGKGFYFFSDMTATPGSTPSLGRTGFEVSDMLVGTTQFTATGLPGFPEKKTYNWENSAFVQDDWAVSDRLTLNLGLRYDVFTPYVEQNDRLANYTPATQGIVLAGQGGVPRATVNTDWNNFGPRFGAAYQISPQMVARGAYGIFYTLDRGGIDNQLTENPPFVVSQFRFDGPGSSVRLSDPIPLPEAVDPSKPVLPLGSALVYIPADNRTSQMQQYNASVERELGGNASMLVAYVGTKGRNLTAVATQAQFGGEINSRLTTVTNIASSTYNALQLQLRQRMIHGLTYLASYTLGKATNNSPGPYPGPGGAFRATPSDPKNLSLDFGPADYDRRHYFSFAATYEIPWMRSAQGASGALVGGWQVNTIVTLASGSPFSVYGGDGGRAKLIGTVTYPHTVKQWFDPSAFAPSKTASEQSSRNLLRAPGISTVDASLFKTFRVAADQGIEFRIEAFNLFNHPQYGIPGIYVGASDFSQITSIRLNTQRQIQLALRYTF